MDQTLILLWARDLICHQWRMQTKDWVFNWWCSISLTRFISDFFHPSLSSLTPTVSKGLAVADHVVLLCDHSCCHAWLAHDLLIRSESMCMHEPAILVPHIGSSTSRIRSSWKMGGLGSDVTVNIWLAAHQSPDWAGSVVVLKISYSLRKCFWKFLVGRL